MKTGKMVIARAAPFVYHDTIASLDKGTHGFHGSKRHLASLSSLMGDSPSASSALPAAVYPPGKLGDPPGVPARGSSPGAQDCCRISVKLL